MKPKAQEQQSETHSHRAYVGPVEKYDIVGAMQFNLLTLIGLREYHYLLDVGCGSLKAGRFFIIYLLPGRYFGIEPEQWLIQEGIKKEIGMDQIRIRKPVFNNDSNFTLSIFKRKFDFILAHSIFSHASQQQIRRCLSEAKKVMKQTSIFATTFIEGEENYTGEKWLYPDCVTYRLEYMIELVEEQGLTCKPIDWPNPNQQTWILIVKPENESIPNLGDSTKLLRLESELRFYKEQLKWIKDHPVIKVGLKIYRIIDRIRPKRWKQWI